ncbi:hypothetical protein BLL52_2220 [Rhodoferax antarcticus ANT.BR]|uniref:Uncharacterized protein n=1 Tax=Rhodoferax antarcticus ANT.BR TaxID=1111071 RepID=A0A1Q8YD58_9BURK|nr:hypothetical protein BLL52_2220 [Rhodoferax antarcticus ANT.BR]
MGASRLKRCASTAGSEFIRNRALALINKARVAIIFIVICSHSATPLTQKSADTGVLQVHHHNRRLQADAALT